MARLLPVVATMPMRDVGEAGFPGCMLCFGEVDVQWVGGRPAMPEWTQCWGLVGLAGGPPVVMGLDSGPVSWASLRLSGDWASNPLVFRKTTGVPCLLYFRQHTQDTDVSYT